jgi:ribA/ribD-fused uncharacterized protein
VSDVITTDAHVFFWNGWPSQWYASRFSIDNVEYSCCEQFMMAEKARVFRDAQSERAILDADHPKAQKALGRNVRGFDEAIWNSVCRGIVYRGNLAKFGQNDPLRVTLLGTEHRVIVEASPYDRIWGIGLAPDDDRIHNPAKWRGSNWLGIAIMQVRDQLRQTQDGLSASLDAELRLQLERRELMG